MECRKRSLKGRKERNTKDDSEIISCRVKEMKEEWTLYKPKIHSSYEKNRTGEEVALDSLL